MKKKRNEHNRYGFVCILLVLVGVFFGLVSLLKEANVSSTEGNETTVPETSIPETTVPETTAPQDKLSEAELLLNQMTQWEKIGQLFIVRPEMLVLTQPGTTENEAGFKSVTSLMEKALKDYPVGGIAMFNRNLQSPTQIKKFNADLQAISKVPLFVAIDEEGGAVSRIANNKAFNVPTYESVAAVGATADAGKAKQMGSTIGAYLWEYGFNMDFAPVADVYTNPQNTVIGNRAFSSDPQIVAKMAEAMAEGLRSQNITPVFKHFPGHGDTAQDSHYELAVSYKTLDEMVRCEWLPFMEATDQDFVMLAHVAAPKITGDMLPATLSYKLVTECLRGKCGFEGLIITDSFAMDAIKNTYGVGEAAVMAFQAGCDMVLMPEDVKACFDAVEKALDNGVLTQQWLDATVLRILEFKIYQRIVD